MTSPNNDVRTADTARPTKDVKLSTGRTCTIRMPGVLSIRRFQTAVRRDQEEAPGVMTGTTDAAIALIVENLIDPPVTNDEEAAKAAPPGAGIPFYDDVLGIVEIGELLQALIDFAGVKQDAARPSLKQETTTP